MLSHIQLLQWKKIQWNSSQKIHYLKENTNKIKLHSASKHEDGFLSHLSHIWSVDSILAVKYESSRNANQAKSRKPSIGAITSVNSQPCAHASSLRAAAFQSSYVHIKSRISAVWSVMMWIDERQKFSRRKYKGWTLDLTQGHHIHNKSLYTSGIALAWIWHSWTTWLTILWPAANSVLN